MTTIDQHRQLHRKADNLLWTIDCCKTKITMHRRVIADRDTTGMNPETVARLNASSERQISNIQREREQLWQQYGKLVAEIADMTFPGMNDTIAPTLERYAEVQ